MSIFSFDIKNKLVLSDLTDEYSIMCSEFGTIIDSYHIKPEIYSDTFWSYLTENYKIDSNCISSRVELEVDEKNRIHKRYKYVVKCKLNKNDFIMISFFDENKSYDDTDYRSFASEDDKRNKVNDIIIYYEPNKIDTKALEDSIVDKLLGLVYVPSTKNQFFIINTSQHGYGLKASYIRDVDIDLEMNYGKSFVPIYEKIFDNLYNKKNGLFLFHGCPGSGKCVDGETFVTLRNKKTGEVMNITIDEFNKINK